MSSRSPSNSQMVSVELVSDQLTLSMSEVCQRCGLQRDDVRQLVAYGVVMPLSESDDDWQFAGDTLHLLARAARMQRDFDLDAAGLAMALSLLDELQRSRRQVEKLSQLLAQHVQL